MKRYKVSNLLQVYWAVRVLEHFFCLVIDSKFQNETMYDILKYLLIIKGCDTPLAVLAMGNFISYFGYHIGSFFNWVTNLTPKNFGYISFYKMYYIFLGTINRYSGLSKH